MPTFKAADGTTLHYSDQGAGTPVLALAGLTRNGADFDYVAPHLKDIRLITMDYRGRGRSDWTDPITYTIPTEATDALALLDHLDLPAAAIVGTSRGGLIALLLGAMARDRLTGVCLVDIGPELMDTGLDVIKDYIDRNPVQKTFQEAAAMRATLLSGFENVPPERWEAEVRRHYVATPDGLAITYDPRLRDAVLAAAEQPMPDLWPLFDALAGLPVACIRGANSDLLAQSTLDEMQRRRPDLIAVNVPDRGHVPFLDEPTAIDALNRWIQALS